MVLGTASSGTLFLQRVFVKDSGERDCLVNPGSRKVSLSLPSQLAEEAGGAK